MFVSTQPHGRALRAVIASLCAVAALALAPAAYAAVGGPVILGGDDLTDHGSFDTGTNTNQAGWLYLQRALENVSPKVTRANDGTIAALGSADSNDTGGGDAGAAIHFAAQNAGLTVTYYDGATAISDFFTALANGSTNPRIIWIAGDNASNNLDGCSGAGTEGQALIDNANQINSFVNAGGGLISHGVCYDWLAALIPGIQSIVSGSSGDLYFTPEGQNAFPGVTVNDINAGPWHSNFDGDLGGLQVLVRSSTVKDSAGGDAPVIIGGAGVSLTQKSTDLEITKSASPNPVTVGGNLTYTLTVTNKGPADAANVVVTDTLPAGVSFVSSSASQGTCSGTAPVSCNLGTVASGAAASVTIVVRPTAAGTLRNSAHVTSDQPDPTSANDDATTDTTVVNPAAPPKTCVDQRRFKFEVHHGPGSRVVKVKVFIDGKLVRTVRGRNLKEVTINRLPQRFHSVKIIVYLSNGSSRTSKRVYLECTKGKPKVRSHHHRRHRRHSQRR